MGWIEKGSRLVCVTWSKILIDQMEEWLTMASIRGKNIDIWHEKGLWHCRNEYAEEIRSGDLEFIANRVNLVAVGVSNKLTFNPIDEEMELACSDVTGAIVCMLKEKR